MLKTYNNPLYFLIYLAIHTPIFNKTKHVPILLEEDVNVMPRPSRSLRLISIENVGDTMERKPSTSHHPPQSLAQLNNDV